jgi:Nucleoside-diphosphate-sugar pyrophosphorylase involved in lipopolysaccharide biosynthesis/translation initiation factor 2B, gamma/epsilon subunits (eIF-2Bgamma/eIF-2Bepsilon)
MKIIRKTLKKNLSINYIWEDSPLGTVGALSKLQNISHDHILLSNSDILTDLNYEDFYLDFVKKDSDFQILTIPFNFSVPFAVLEIENESVLSLKEKPSLKHECNAGIYLMKKEIIELIPKETLFDATDLIEMLIELGKKVTSFPFNGYWLDIGRHDDFKKAQNDINKIK